MKFSPFHKFAPILLLLATTAAVANEDVRVAVVLNSEDAVLGERLHAELATLGFGVVSIEPNSQEIPLDVVARQASAVAAIRVVSALGGVEVWIADRVTGKTLLRQIVAGGNGAPAAPADIALQAVELLRASLLELGTAYPNRGDVKPPLRVRELAEESAANRPNAPPNLYFDLGGGVLASPGGIPMSPYLQLALGWNLGWRLRARLLAEVPLQAARVSALEGTATVSTTMVGAGLDLRFTGTDSLWQFVAGLGLGVWWLQMQGSGTTPMVGVARGAVTSAPYGHVEASLRLTRRLHLLADGLCGYALAQPRLRFIDRTVAVFGRPGVTTTLSLRVDWP